MPTSLRRRRARQRGRRNHAASPGRSSGIPAPQADDESCPKKFHEAIAIARFRMKKASENLIRNGTEAGPLGFAGTSRPDWSTHLAICQKRTGFDTSRRPLSDVVLGVHLGALDGCDHNPGGGRVCALRRGFWPINSVRLTSAGISCRPRPVISTGSRWNGPCFFENHLT